MFFAHGVSATNRCFRVLWAGLGRHNVTDRRETFCVPHGDIHKTEGNHANLAGACILTSGVDYWESAARLDPLVTAGSIIRTWGDSYGYLLVATGRADAMVDPIVNRWDVAPMLTILPEAGGLFTDMAGNVTADGGDAIATNPKLHAALMAAVGRSPVH